MRRSSFCNHYRAMSEHETCEAGVAYEKFKGIPFDNRPCFCTDGKPNGGGCDKAEYPTPEELAAEKEWMAKRFEAIGKAREAIVAACGGPWKKGQSGHRGAIECPNCKGKLAFSRSDYNGHIHASCATKGCVSWME